MDGDAELEFGGLFGDDDGFGTLQPVLAVDKSSPEASPKVSTERNVASDGADGAKRKGKLKKRKLESEPKIVVQNQIVWNDEKEENQIYRPADKTRAQGVKLLEKILSLKVSVAIEQQLFEKHGESISKDYKAKLRSLSFNLKKNEELRKELEDGC